jgi:hypothetical protein
LTYFAVKSTTSEIEGIKKPQNQREKKHLELSTSHNVSVTAMLVNSFNLVSNHPVIVSC